MTHKHRAQIALRRFKKKYGRVPTTDLEIDIAFREVKNNRTYEEYFEYHDFHTMREARKAAEEYMAGYEDVPRFADPATNELLKKHGRRHWCQDSYEQRILKWLIKHDLGKKSVRAIARAAHTDEAYCLRLFHQYAWEAYRKKERRNG